MRVLNGIDATFAVFTLNVCIPTTMMMAMPRRKSKYGKRFFWVIVNKKDSRYDRGQGHHIWFRVKGSGFMIHGSWLRVQDSWFVVKGSWLMVHGS